MKRKEVVGIIMWILGMALLVGGIFVFFKPVPLYFDAIGKFILGLVCLFWSHHLMQSGNKLVTSVGNQSKKKVNSK